MFQLKRLKSFLIFICLFSLFLAACGDGGDELPVTNPDDGVAETTVDSTEDTVIDESDPTPEPVEEATDVPEETAVVEEPTEEPADEVAPEPTEEPAEEATPEPVEESGETGETAVNGKAGMACFGTSGEGLTCLNAAGEWIVYNQDNSDLYIDFISSLDECNGDLIIGLSSSLTLFDGTSFRDFPDREDFGSNEDAVCDDQGGVWVAHFKGVSYFDGTSWTTYDETNLGDETLVMDVALAPNGDLWVLTSNKIATFDGTDWTLFSEGQGFDDNYFFKNMIIDHQGVVWASHGGGLLVYGDGAWSERDSGGFLTPRGLASDTDGNIYLGTFADGLQIYDQSTWGSVDLSSAQVEAIDVDDNGRVWVGTEYGINVWDGSERRVYRMDNADLSSNRFVEVVVVGGGPVLPDPIAKEPGSMIGFFTLDGAPYADAIVEICVEELYSSFNGPTPCSEQPYSQQATTDENGTFTFVDVPVGLYSIVVQTEDSWAKYSGEFSLGSEFVPVFDGEETDVGELLLTTEEDE